MKEFIAKFGYTLAWAFGYPKKSLQEDFEGWYKFGLSWIILSSSLIFILTVVLIIMEIHYKSEGD